MCWGMTEIEFAQIVAASLAANGLAISFVLGLYKITKHEKNTGSPTGAGFLAYFAVLFPLLIGIIGVLLVRS